MFKGVYTAIATPFSSGKLDEAAFQRLIASQIKGKVDGIVPAGTTGESPTLTYEEHIHLVDLSVRFARKKTKVIAGTGGNSTEEAIYLTKAAEHSGADASLQVAPYYNKPSQEGLFQHFRAIARATKLPIILYSVPGRCGVEIGLETVQRLAAECQNIVGIKEAGGNPDRVSHFHRVMPKTFSILSGDDSLTLPFMAVGAHGVVSVASNIIPGEISAMVRHFAAGNVTKALHLHSKFYPLFRNLFLETNPVPIKAALAMAKQIKEEYRLPLVPMSPSNRSVLEATLRECKVLP